MPSLELLCVHKIFSILSCNDNTGSNDDDYNQHERWITYLNNILKKVKTLELHLPKELMKFTEQNIIYRSLFICHCFKELFYVVADGDYYISYTMCNVCKSNEQLKDHELTREKFFEKYKWKSSVTLNTLHSVCVNNTVRELFRCTNCNLEWGISYLNTFLCLKCTTNYYNMLPQLVITRLWKVHIESDDIIKVSVNNIHLNNRSWYSNMKIIDFANGIIKRNGLNIDTTNITKMETTYYMHENALKWCEGKVECIINMTFQEILDYGKNILNNKRLSYMYVNLS